MSTLPVSYFMQEKVSTNSTSNNDTTSKKDVSLIRENADIVRSLFEQNRLLARATENEVLSDDKLRFESHDREIEGMRSDRLKNVSCTLLVPQENVTTYKPYGFLFNGKTSEILHAATHDIGSATDNNGSLIAPTEENMSLEELVDFIKNTPPSDRYTMNEVNANFTEKDLVGLFICSVQSAIPQIEILLVQQRIKQKYGLDLPIYAYDQIKGELTPYQNKEKINRFLFELKTQRGIAFTQPVARLLGFSMTDKGQLTPFYVPKTSQTETIV